MKICMETAGGRTVTIDNTDGFVYLTIKDLDGNEMHVRLLTQGINGNEVEALRDLLGVVS